MSKSLTVEEFVKATENGVYSIENEDSCNIRVEMMKASIDYDKDFHEIIFNLVGGGASFFLDTELINEITEENGNFNISFNEAMSDLSVTKNND